MSSSLSRRRFLGSAPCAAVATAIPIFAEDKIAAPTPFKLVSAAELAKMRGSLTAHPGNFDFLADTALPVTATLTCEEKKAAAEFEWHEGRDHLVQIVDGETLYEVGGSPEGGKSKRPGEWLAPESTGATKMLLREGDWLIIPRNTPHKRTTTANVTFILISTVGSLVK